MFQWHFELDSRKSAEGVEVPPSKPYAATFRSTAAKTADTTPPNPMRSLLARLRAAGLPTPYVRQFLLPDWWDDEAAASPVGFTEAIWTISRHLGLPAEMLRDPSQEITLPRHHGVQFKLTSGVEEKDVELARLLGEQVAKFALLGVPRAAGLLESAHEIRMAILETGAPWVSFGALLDYCWRIGIPVLHLSELPARKFDGMAVNIDGRPAIVLASAKACPWLLFHLSHELGHVVLGHGEVIDDTIDEDSTDPQERAANDFAIELITGRVGRRISMEGRWPNAHDLAKRAQRLGLQESVDPGHIVLNYAHWMSRGGKKNFWPVASAALRRLPFEGEPAAMIRERTGANLDWSNLPTEAAEFVARMSACNT